MKVVYKHFHKSLNGNKEQDIVDYFNEIGKEGWHVCSYYVGYYGQINYYLDGIAWKEEK